MGAHIERGGVRIARAVGGHTHVRADGAATALPEHDRHCGHPVAVVVRPERRCLCADSARAAR